MFSSCKALGIDPPSITESQRPDKVRVSITYGRKRQTVGIDEKILAIIARDPKITAGNIAIELGVGKSVVVAAINRLKEKGTLSRIGGPRGKWAIDE